MLSSSLSVGPYTDRLIIKYRDPSIGRASTLGTKHLNALRAQSGIGLAHVRSMSGQAHVLRLPQQMTLSEATVIARTLAADASIEYVEPDRRMLPMAVPNDPQYVNQWHYMTPNAPDYVAGGVNLPGAWDITTGSSSLVVAFIDTGLRPHTDIDSNILDGTGRVVPGYDFISLDYWQGNNRALTANDGDGRDSDPTDPGDWISAAESAGTDATGGFFKDCTAASSSWHGTHLAGTIGATTNNALGVAGTNWNAKILPVRVLGKCGGYTSDIADGMRWAAGLSVVGVPTNANPAKVLNVSLGGSGRCGATFQSAISDVIAAGATVVVAAGNEDASASETAPANCNGVISVSAVNRSGGRAYYSNYGTTVKIAAPGGEQSYSGDPDGVLSTSNSGTTTPVASPGGDSYKYYQGTSMATPHVSGIVSLMLSVAPSLTPAQVLQYIQGNARTFPTGTGLDCTTTTCGAGIIDAAATLAALSGANVTLTVTAAPSPATIGQHLIHTITVTNSGKAAAQSVTVTDTLSGSFAFVSATPSQGTCSGSGPVTCSLGSLNSGATATIALVVMPTAAGVINSAAIVSTVVGGSQITGKSASLSTSIENPLPSIIGILPTSATAGSSAFSLTVNGTNFINGVSTVQWNNAARATLFVSSTQLIATIPASDVAAAGTATVTIINSSPGGGTSTAAPFTITSTAAASSSGGGGGGGGCFIATAAFGSYAHPAVKILRTFRDRILLRHGLGQAFVTWYYRVSPPIAAAIGANEVLKAGVKMLLLPVVAFGYLSSPQGLLPACILLLLAGSLLYGMVRRAYLSSQTSRR